MKKSRLLAAIIGLVLLQACAPTLPKSTNIDSVRWLNQNWSADERHWFHHASQGTATLPVPYSWFVALEQPTLELFKTPPLLKEPAYLSRFGFIPSPKTAPFGSGGGGQRNYGSAVNYSTETYAGNPDSLPVGFAKTKAENTLDKKGDLIGFTCAACHTGHMEYKGTSIRIDGGPAVTDLDKFRTALVLSLAYTKYVPFRFDRFADRVLGKDRSGADRERLKADLDARLDAILEVAEKLKELDINAVEEGFARLDALNRIGNQVFVTDFLQTPTENLGFDPWDNYETTDAPVNFPHIWSTSWFDWVQYDASIMQPVVRNAGEALGVSAQINIGNPTHSLYASSVLVRDVHEMEKLLAGDNPFLKKDSQIEPRPHFKGLRAPIWPSDLFDSPDLSAEDRAEMVTEGRDLYMKLCKSCHGFPVNDRTGAFWRDADRWTPANDAGERYYKVTTKPQTDVGTDPAQANVLATRMVKVPPYLKLPANAALCGQAPKPPAPEMLFGSALAGVVERTAEAWYDKHDIPPAERAAWNGHRPNCIQAKRAYKARPLNGIWATAPFLHNGSVPNLYSLLLPAAERPKKFCLGHLGVRSKTRGLRARNAALPVGNVRTGYHARRQFERRA